MAAPKISTITRVGRGRNPRIMVEMVDATTEQTIASITRKGKRIQQEQIEMNNKSVQISEREIRKIEQRALMDAKRRPDTTMRQARAYDRALGVPRLQQSGRAAGRGTMFAHQMARSAGTMGVTSNAALGGQAAGGMLAATTGLGLPAIAAATGSIILGSQAIQAYSQYEQEVTKAVALVDGGSKQVTAQLADQTREIAKKWAQPTQELAWATYQALSGAVGFEDTGRFIDVAARFAKGEFLNNAAQGVDLLTTVINSYGFAASDAADITDKLSETIRFGKITAEEMAGSMATITPIAAAMGISFEEVLGMIAAMTAQGVNASEATTYARRAIVELGNEAGKAGKHFRRLAGEDFKVFIENGGKVVDAMKIMTEGAKAEGTSVANFFGRIQATQAAQILTSDAGYKRYQEALAGLDDSFGVTARKAYLMKQTTANSIAQLGVVATDLLLTVGEFSTGLFDPLFDSWQQGAYKADIYTDALIRQNNEMEQNQSLLGSYALGQQAAANVPYSPDARQQDESYLRRAAYQYIRDTEYEFDEKVDATVIVDTLVAGIVDSSSTGIERALEHIGLRAANALGEAVELPNADKYRKAFEDLAIGVDAMNQAFKQTNIFTKYMEHDADAAYRLGKRLDEGSISIAKATKIITTALGDYAAYIHADIAMGDPTRSTAPQIQTEMFFPDEMKQYFGLLKANLRTQNQRIRDENRHRKEINDRGEISQWMGEVDAATSATIDNTKALRELAGSTGFGHLITPPTQFTPTGSSATYDTVKEYLNSFTVGGIDAPFANLTPGQQSAYGRAAWYKYEPDEKKGKQGALERGTLNTTLAKAITGLAGTEGLAQSLRETFETPYKEYLKQQQDAKQDVDQAVVDRMIQNAADAYMSGTFAAGDYSGAFGSDDQLEDATKSWLDGMSLMDNDFTSLDPLLQQIIRDYEEYHEVLSGVINEQTIMRTAGVELAGNQGLSTSFNNFIDQQIKEYTDAKQSTGEQVIQGDIDQIIATSVQQLLSGEFGVGDYSQIFGPNGKLEDSTKSLLDSIGVMDDDFNTLDPLLQQIIRDYEAHHESLLKVNEELAQQSLQNDFANEARRRSFDARLQVTEGPSGTANLTLDKMLRSIEATQFTPTDAADVISSLRRSGEISYQDRVSNEVATNLRDALGNYNQRVQDLVKIQQDASVNAQRQAAVSQAYTDILNKLDSGAFDWAEWLQNPHLKTSQALADSLGYGNIGLDAIQGRSQFDYDTLQLALAQDRKNIKMMEEDVKYAKEAMSPHDYVEVLRAREKETIAKYGEWSFEALEIWRKIQGILEEINGKFDSLRINIGDSTRDFERIMQTNDGNYVVDPAYIESLQRSMSGI